MKNRRLTVGNDSTRAWQRKRVMAWAFVAAMALLSSAALAQAPPPVTYQSDFQSYKSGSTPAGWSGAKAGDPGKSDATFHTATDPVGAHTNIVFGTSKSEGSSDDEKSGKRVGDFSIYATTTFAAGHFDLQGRMLKMASGSLAGLTILSTYPCQDRYYIIKEASRGDGKTTMQLGSFGAGPLQGTTDSALTLDAARWYRFRIDADDVNAVTTIKARFWPDGTTEPSSWSIDALDNTGT